MKVAKPWYREQTASWYVQLGGRQHPLGKHPAHLPPPKKESGEWRPPREIAAGQGDRHRVDNTPELRAWVLTRRH
jgi:hypothetical protein